MKPFRDDELINNRAFHQAVRTHRATLTGASSASIAPLADWMADQSPS